MQEVIYIAGGKRRLGKTEALNKWQGIPDCSEPDEKAYPPNINAMLADIKRYRQQRLDPAGYREELRQIQERAALKAVKGSKEGDKKE